jgi:tRNA A37 threonylcarbamoyladenosine synthetase subunit TsaC/SUA5/YrdC
MVAPSAAASAAAAFTTAEAHAIRDDHGEHPGKVGRGAGARGTESLIRGATLPAGN